MPICVSSIPADWPECAPDRQYKAEFADCNYWHCDDLAKPPHTVQARIDAELPVSQFAKWLRGYDSLGLIRLTSFEA